MIRWTGYTTDGRKVDSIEARTYCELFNALVSKNIIPESDYDPYLMAVAEKNNISYDEFFDEDDNYIFDEVFAAKGMEDLTEEDYARLIKEHNENAFYQETEEY